MLHQTAATILLEHVLASQSACCHTNRQETHRPLQLGRRLDLNSLFGLPAYNGGASRQHHACASVQLPHNPGVGLVGVVTAGAVGLQHTVHHLHKACKENTSVCQTAHTDGKHTVLLSSNVSNVCCGCCGHSPISMHSAAQ